MQMKRPYTTLFQYNDVVFGSGIFDAPNPWEIRHPNHPQRSSTYMSNARALTLQDILLYSFWNEYILNLISFINLQKKCFVKNKNASLLTIILPNVFQVFCDPYFWVFVQFLDKCATLIPCTHPVSYKSANVTLQCTIAAHNLTLPLQFIVRALGQYEQHLEQTVPTLI